MKNMDNSDNFKQFYTVWDSSVFLSPSAHLLRTEIKRPCREVFTLPIRAIRIGPPDQFLIRKAKKTMQEMGLEPTRSCDHRHLKPARLPIPPLLHFLSCGSHVPFNKTYITRWFRICQQLFSNFFKKFQIFFFAPKSPPSAGLFGRSCITWTPGRKLPSAAQFRRKYRNQKHWTQVCGTSPVQTGSWHSRSRNLSYAGHTSSTCRRQS